MPPDRIRHLTSNVQIPTHKQRLVAQFSLGRPRVWPLFALFRLVGQPFTIPFKLGEGGWEKRLDDSEPEDHAGGDATQEE